MVFAESCVLTTCWVYGVKIFCKIMCIDCLLGVLCKGHCKIIHMYQLLAGYIVLRYLQEHEFVLRKSISKIICINYLLAVLCKGIYRIMCTNCLLSVLSIGTVFKKIQ